MKHKMPHPKVNNYILPFICIKSNVLPLLKIKKPEYCSGICGVDGARAADWG
jgi:hypothetical protein